MAVGAGSRACGRRINPRAAGGGAFRRCVTSPTTTRARTSHLRGDSAREDCSSTDVAPTCTSGFGPLFMRIKATASRSRDEQVMCSRDGTTRDRSRRGPDGPCSHGEGRWVFDGGSTSPARHGRASSPTSTTSCRHVRVSNLEHARSTGDSREPRPSRSPGLTRMRRS